MRSRTLPSAGLVIGAWAVVPPYLGPALATDARVEIADHVVPAIVILALSTALVVRRAAIPAIVMFAAGLTIALAGLWMFLTHVPLLAQAARGQAPVLAVAWHSVPGVAVIVLGVVWVLQHAETSLPGHPSDSKV